MRLLPILITGLFAVVSSAAAQVPLLSQLGMQPAGACRTLTTSDFMFGGTSYPLSCDEPDGKLRVLGEGFVLTPTVDSGVDTDAVIKLYANHQTGIGDRFFHSSGLFIRSSPYAAQDNLELGSAATSSFGKGMAHDFTVDSNTSLLSVGRRSLATRTTVVAGVRDSPHAYGAVCDGTTNDSAAISAAVAAGGATIPGPLTTCVTTYSLTSLPGPLRGPGRVATVDGNKRAPLFTTVQARPSAFGNFDSPLAAWNGDLRGVGIAHEHVVTGAATLGQPSSGYQQAPETSAEILSVYSTSGYNASTSSNSGRTGTAGKYYRIANYGQGDLVAIQCSGIVGSSLPDAKSFLAMPAIECLGGDLYASANGQYLEFLGDMNLNDNGYDIAAAGIVLNMRRTNAAEGLGALWMGARFQNQGTQPVDAIVSAAGKAAIGIDLSGLDLSTYSLAQISLKVGGSGYAVGDVLSMSGGTHTVRATIQVTAVSSGAITEFKIVNAGLYSVSPLSGTTTAWEGGSGSNATFYAAFNNGAALVLPQRGCIKGNPTAATFPNAMVRGTTNTICNLAGGMTVGNGGQILSAAGAGVVQIGTSNLSRGVGNVQLGTNTYDEAQKNALLFSSGHFTDTANFGSSQISERIMRGTASSTDPIRLTTDQAAAGAQNSYLVVPSSVSSLELRCNAVDTVNGDMASWKLMQGVVNRVGSGSVAYQGDATSAKVPDYSIGAGSTTTITVSADISAQALNITFMPPSGNARKWHAQCSLRALKVM